MTSITFRHFTKLDWAFVVGKSAILVYAVVLIACSSCSKVPQPPAQRLAGYELGYTLPAPPASMAAPHYEDKTETPVVLIATAPSFYGWTYWDETLTSAYYYPKGGVGDAAVPATHLKFNHREDDQPEDSYFKVNGLDNDWKTSIGGTIKKAYFKIQDDRKAERRRQYEELKKEFEPEDASGASN